MRYKLTTLPKETAKMPILELPNASLTFNGPGITQTITPNTRNAPNESYTFILQDASIANLSVRGEVRPSAAALRAEAPLANPAGLGREDDLPIRTGVTTPVFLNESERKRSITITGTSVNVIARSITSQTSTNITVVGNESGATFNLPITVKADPSKI
jgi:hypothetical protein